MRLDFQGEAWGLAPVETANGFRAETRTFIQKKPSRKIACGPGSLKSMETCSGSSRSSSTTSRLCLMTQSTQRSTSSTSTSNQRQGTEAFCPHRLQGRTACTSKKVSPRLNGTWCYSFLSADRRFRRTQNRWSEHRPHLVEFSTTKLASRGKRLAVPGWSRRTGLDSPRSATRPPDRRREAAPPEGGAVRYRCLGGLGHQRRLRQSPWKRWRRPNPNPPLREGRSRKNTTGSRRPRPSYNGYSIAKVHRLRGRYAGS